MGRCNTCYYSSALGMEDVESLSIDRLEGRQASADSNDPVIAPTHVMGVTVRGSLATEGASTFHSANEVTDEGFFEGNNLGRARLASKSETGFKLRGNLLPAKD